MGLYSEFWVQLNNIQKILFLSDESMGEILNLTGQEYEKARLSCSGVNIHDLDSLLDRVGLGIDNFFEGNYDPRFINKYFYGGVSCLPERYSSARFSKSRTIINCLRFIELKFGVDFKRSILRTLQLDISFFDNPDRDLNIKLLRDLCNLLLKMGLKSRDFIEMGRMSYQVNRENGLGKLFISHRRVDDLMIDICENHSVRFDQNFDYFVTSRRRGEISVGSRPSEKVLEYLSHDEIGSEEICLTKLGVFSSFPLYLRKKYTFAEKTRCMRSGDPYYEYKISFS